MDYAIQLLLPIIGGLMLGMWLTRHFGVSPIWTVVLAILGMAGGIGIMVKRFSVPKPVTHPKQSPELKAKPKPADPAHRHWTDMEKTETIDDPLPDEFADEFDRDEMDINGVNRTHQEE
ncbi:MAG TPA: AtpZ/AtpI family protein [Coleofasciculaceae cyanobacterium]